MSRETVLEHRQSVAPVTTATLTTVVDSDAVTGTNLDEFVANDIIWWIDEAGAYQQNQVQTATDATNMTLYRNALTLTTANVPRLVAVALQREYWFRANNAVNRAFIIRPDTDQRTIMLLAAPGSSDFVLISANEGVLLKTAYIRLPYQYTMGSAPFMVGFYYVDSAGALIGRIPNIGETSLIHIPRENTEVEINAYIPPPLLSSFGTAGAWSIAATIETCVGPDLDDDDPSEPSNLLPYVSMVNSPDVLNGQQMQVSVGARILHADTAMTV